MAGPIVSRGIQAAVPYITGTKTGAQKLQQAAELIPNAPIGPSGALAQDEALRALQLGGGNLGGKVVGRGGTLPKVLRDYINTQAELGGNPMTYEVAKDFAKNSGRLSAEEAMKISPSVKGETKVILAKFVKAMKAGVQEGADQANPIAGQLNAEGMSEYAKGMLARRLAPKVLKYGIGTGLAGAGGAAGYKAWNALNANR
jgi:hypothetical protein